MSISDLGHPAGRRWHRRVRALTGGVVGAAIVGTAGLTAVLAHSQTDQDASSAVSVAAGSDSTGTDATSTGSDSTTDSGTSTGLLSSPAQAPAASLGSAHTATGGS